MRVARRHDVIPAETLRELAEEIGVGWPFLVRLTFFVMLVFLAALFVVICGWTVRDVASGRAGIYGTARRLSLLIPPCIGVLMIWCVSARVRFRRISKIILKHNRCPHCGYDLRMLPVDPADGATVCPECGCAWRLEADE
jgi:hypothetical protein